MGDPTAALLYGALALRAAGRAATPGDLSRLADLLGVPEPAPLLLEAIAALVGGLVAGTASVTGASPALAGEAAGSDPETSPPAAAGFAPPGRPKAAGGPGLYVYGIVRASGSDLPGEWTGIDGAPVMLVETGEFALLVHAHSAVPFGSDQAEVVHRWVTEHDAVLARAAERFGDVLPVAFDTIIAREGSDPVVLARDWIAQRASELRAAFQRIAGAREYSVQVFWEEEQVQRHLAEADPELQRLTVEAAGESPGKAYFLRERLRQAVHQALEKERARRVEAYRHVLAGQARELRVERPKQGSDEKRRMIASFTCLLSPQDEGRLAAALEAVQAPWESIRLAGPWAPYSFSNAPADAALPPSPGG